MISDFIQKQQLPAYREKQFFQAFYKEYISSFDELTTWPKILREQLKNDVPFSTLTPLQSSSSTDTTTEKVVFQRADKSLLETVLMRHENDRNTICVSCMVGCPVGCTFCATGKMGFVGNLTAQEIVDQVLYLARILKKENKTITNIVFMGMGEPLMNINEVMGAISILTDPKKMGLSARRILLSTSGLTPMIRALPTLGYAGRLALSLHAPNQTLRETIMPIAKRFPLPELMDALRFFSETTKQRVSCEYILIKDWNDQPSHARELATLVSEMNVHINLIPYNPVPGVAYERPSLSVIHRFSSLLTKAGIQNTCRVTMGDDIQAACGQLATRTVAA